jgi:hypothetical protein
VFRFLRSKFDCIRGDWTTQFGWILIFHFGNRANYSHCAWRMTTEMTETAQIYDVASERAEPGISESGRSFVLHRTGAGLNVGCDEKIPSSSIALYFGNPPGASG